MSNWPMVKLGEIALGGKGQYGIGAPSVDYSPHLYTYLRITDINDDGTLNKNNLKSVEDENAYKYILEPNDIVFARTGASTGRNYFYDGRDGILVYAGFLIKFSVNEKKVNPKYVKYFCQSEQYKNWIQSFNTGSTRGNINAQTFANLEIELPTREQQDLLVKILSSLDDKIEVNNQINKNLEEQAQVIFKSWFVDFEPFGGTMPDDWQEGVLGEFVTISNKSFNPLKENDVLLEHYSIPAFDAEKFPVFELSSEIKSNKFMIDKYCFMISKLNPTTKRVWKPYCLSDKAVCSTEFIVYKAKDPADTGYFYALIDSDKFSDFMCSHVTGSTGSRQRTTPSMTLNYPLYAPPKEIRNKFSEVVNSIYEQIRNNHVENSKLKRLRDKLLPKLMGGEIELKEGG